MANMAALNCLKAKRTGKYFTLEHPKNSIARDLESWKDLEAEEGVWATEYHSCMFKGSARRKAQILIHNIPLLNSNLNLICNSSRICTRTGKPHLSWKPRVEKGRVTSFATGLEREYPEGFCETYAQAIVQATQNPIQSFVEVFSGPNAPLSCALAKAWGVPSPIPPGTVTPWNHKHRLVLRRQRHQCLEFQRSHLVRLLQPSQRRHEHKQWRPLNSQVLGRGNSSYPMG